MTPYVKTPGQKAKAGEVPEFSASLPETFTTAADHTGAKPKTGAPLPSNVEAAKRWAEENGF